MKQNLRIFHYRNTYENRCLIISYLFKIKGEKEKSPSPQKQENTVRSENDDNYVNNTGPTNVGEKTKQFIQEEENEENSHHSKIPGILNAGLGNECMRTFANHTTSTTTYDNKFKEAVSISKDLPNGRFE